MTTDRPSEFEIERYDSINNALLEATVLAGRVSLLVNNGADMYTVHREVNQDLIDVVRSLDGEDVGYTYTGNGFFPVFDYDNDQPKTAFGSLRSARGSFSSISLLDATDLNYIAAVDPKSDEENYEDSRALLSDMDDDSDDYDDNDFEAILRTPKTHPALYMEFVTRESRSDQLLVGGIAMRSESVTYYNVMDLGDLVVDQIEVRDDAQSVGEHEIPELLMNTAKHMKSLKRSTGFRRLSRDKQLRRIDTKISEVNARLGLNRVRLVINVDKVYVPSIAGQSRDMRLTRIATEGSTQIVIDPIEIDSVEMFKMSAGEKITSDRNMQDVGAGVCLVGTVQSDLADRLDSADGVVWVPLGDCNAEDFTIVSI